MLGLDDLSGKPYKRRVWDLISLDWVMGASISKGDKDNDAAPVGDHSSQSSSQPGTTLISVLAPNPVWAFESALIENQIEPYSASRFTASSGPGPPPAPECRCKSQEGRSLKTWPIADLTIAISSAFDITSKL